MLASRLMAVRMDARRRAVRTLVQGMLVDVGVAVCATLSTALADVRWTRAWWVLLGALLVKTSVQTAVAYAARHLVPPK
jgi:hypothetical protein